MSILDVTSIIAMCALLVASGFQIFMIGKRVAFEEIKRLFELDRMTRGE